ncbi:MAG: hypothetical protein MK289_16190 [Trichodesmium sp. ALOHA_ZT_67]|uniref:hypothetical protein n=1 Tax=Trichodesmium erythraeum TaxID=1206 RepID=UPI0002F98611|nr:hypothetical protein [Trichodesmium erythraeum GBRTRLIN201]MCH2049975.1 hypothetical protein [Trichodesmium sp. ALOHA_ZT_67]MDE5096764.1 hypothetical protein [Trichodesmium sp. St11_bin5]MDT9338364.1 hypothetical protein [Trichodesmium erythraeum 21-75]
MTLTDIGMFRALQKLGWDETITGYQALSNYYEIVVCGIFTHLKKWRFLQE